MLKVMAFVGGDFLAEGDAGEGKGISLMIIGFWLCICKGRGISLMVIGFRLCMGKGRGVFRTIICSRLFAGIPWVGAFLAGSLCRGDADGDYLRQPEGYLFLRVPFTSLPQPRG